MKKINIFSVLIALIPFTVMAQDDDLYFIPKKAVRHQITSSSFGERSSYYAGSSRNIDEYNRRGVYHKTTQNVGSDSIGNDIIDFDREEGVYPDSSYIGKTRKKYSKTRRNRDYYDEDDYIYSRRVSRFYDPWFFGYYGYYPYSRWGWDLYDPWYGGYAGYWRGYYSPWYDDWYYPYYGYGWGRPYYYGYGSYYYGYSPYYGGYYGYGWSAPVVTYYNRPISVASRTGIERRFDGVFGGSRSEQNSRATRSHQRSYSTSDDGRFGGRRLETSTPTRSYDRESSFGSGSFGGSFGGSRSVGGSSGGGGFSGGSHSSGGSGQFGGRR